MTSIDEAHDAHEARRRELAANLQHVQQRIVAACLAAGRPLDDVALIAVTKTFPASDVVLLAELGVTDVGENRDQEAAPKVADVAALYSNAGYVGGGVLRWHFVGALQTNKCASVVRYASLIHSVDRLRLVDALARAAQDSAVRCLVQVDLDDTSHPGRAGARQEEVAAIRRRHRRRPTSRTCWGDGGGTTRRRPPNRRSGNLQKSPMMSVSATRRRG